VLLVGGVLLEYLVVGGVLLDYLVVGGVLWSTWLLVGYHWIFSVDPSAHVVPIIIVDPDTWSWKG